jgi:hypothetical protein
LPSVEPPSCVADAGLQICDAGITEVIACACANAECQFWPTGTMGDCHYDSGTLTRYAPGFVLDCKSLEIDVGATVAFEPDPDGGSVDAAPQWSVIGVVGSATVDGTIVALVNSLGQDTTAKVTVPSSDGGPGQTFTYTYVQAEGGAGGSTGWACSGAPDASFRVGSGPR